MCLPMRCGAKQLSLGNEANPVRLLTSIMTWGDEHERGGDGVIRVGRRLGAAACVRGLCHATAAAQTGLDWLLTRLAGALSRR